MTAQRLLTFEEAAEQCSCSAKTLRRAQMCGDLTVIRLGSSAKSDRIHPDDLAAFVAKRRLRTPTLSMRGHHLRDFRPEADLAAERVAKLLNIGRFAEKRKRRSQPLD